MALKGGKPVGLHDDRGMPDLSVLKERRFAETAMSREHLILATDGFAKHVLLDMDGRLGQLIFAGHDVLKGIKGVEQAYRERRARA